MGSFQWQQYCSFYLLLGSIFLLLFLKFLILWSKRKPNLPPSPPKLPIIGNLHQLGNMPHLSLYRLASKFGPIMYLKLGQVPTVVISSAEMAKQVFKIHDLAVSSRPHIFSAKHIFYDCTDIAFSPYGAYWRHIRKICLLELLSAKQVQSYSFVREEEVSRLVHRISESYPNPTNLSKLLVLYTNSVLCRVALGRDFSQGGDYDRRGFQPMLEDLQELLGGFSIGDFFPSMEFLHSLTGMKSRLQHTFQRFDQFLNEIIEEHLNPDTDREKEESTSSSKDLVDVLLEIQRNNGSNEIPLTKENVKAVILDMFAGGTDTSFITLDWGMTELIRNPKLLERAQAQVRKIVGERRVVLESDLPHLDYMKAVINEILRLHPPAPFLVPRESTEDIKIYEFDIPAKTRFIINAWAIGRDPVSWENPESFEPERFLHSPINFKGQDHFQLIPFGAGRRICPGIAFGTATIELALAQLLHSFDWQLPSGTKPQDLDTTEAFGITMHRIAHLMVIAKPHFP